ncbi:MAG TPA: STAS domain-containing protein [Blastocatellia bacterium]|nr:STAS domain-containing protein [Blastocatellia bacterium]
MPGLEKTNFSGYHRATFKEVEDVPNPFAIQTSTQAGISIITLEGFVDAHTAPQFEQAVQTETEAGRCRIIVDCAKLNYISSAGLGVFMSFIEEVREQGGDIKICGLSPKVRHTFEILGFQDLYDLLEDVPTAIQRFEAPVKEG